MLFNSRAAIFPIIPLLTVLILASPLAAIDLQEEFSIALDKKDRIMGSLKGNFLVYNRPTITLYNHRGKAVFSRKLKNNIKPTLSPDGKRLGLVTYADHSPTELKTTKLEIFDEQGHSIFAMTKPKPNAFFIANNGAIFGIEGVQGISPTRVHLFDPYGDLRNILTIENYHGIRIARSGGKFIIDRDNDGLEVYDSLGTMLAHFPPASQFVIDTDDRYIGTFTNGLFKLYQDEQEVTTIRTASVAITKLAINVEQNLLVVMALNRMEVYELVSRNLKWETRLIEKEKQYSSLDLSEDGRFLACGIDINLGDDIPKADRHVQGYVDVYDIATRKMARKRETYSTWAIGLPRVVFSSAGSSVITITKEKLEKLRIK